MSDPDGDPLQFVRKSHPGHGSVTAGPSHDLNYTSDAGYTGADTSRSLARDDRGADSPRRTYLLDVVASLAPTCTPNPAITLRPSRPAHSASTAPTRAAQITYKIVSSPAERHPQPARRLDERVPHLHRAGRPPARTASPTGRRARAARARATRRASRSTRTATRRRPASRTRASRSDVRARAGRRTVPLATLVLRPRQRHADVHAARRRTRSTAPRPRPTAPSPTPPTAGYTGPDSFGYIATTATAARPTSTFSVNVVPPDTADLQRAGRRQRAARQRRGSCSSTASTNVRRPS